MRWQRLLTMVTAIVLTTGCGDDLPEGPGDLQGSVEVGTTAIGAIVVSVSGVGIGAIRGVGSTEAFAEDEVSDSKRVVLVTAQSGALQFSVHVEDRSAPLPTATVVEAVDLNNQPITNLGEITVQIVVE